MSFHEKMRILAPVQICPGCRDPDPIIAKGMYDKSNFCNWCHPDISTGICLNESSVKSLKYQRLRYKSSTLRHVIIKEIMRRKQ